MTVALLASLLVSLTVDPGAGVLVPQAGRRRRRRRRGGPARRPRRRSCAARCSAPTCRSSGFATRRRWLTVGSAVVVFVGTVGLAGLLKTNFFDQSGQTTLSDHARRCRSAPAWPRPTRRPRRSRRCSPAPTGVQTYQVTVGSGGGFFGVGGGGANKATLLGHHRRRTPTCSTLQDTLRDEARRR